MSDIEYRASEISSVSFPNRTIELIVMPYETPAQVEYRGREITEICSRGAFGGVEERTANIRVNRDHDRSKTVGKTVALHPTRKQGLAAEIRISRTELGEETLVLADDGILDASAGFGPLRDKAGRPRADAIVWETRDRRRLNHLFLDHIALTPDPAYVEARVLSVRTDELPARVPPKTPNLDRLELERLRAVYADIDTRYGLSR